MESLSKYASRIHLDDAEESKRAVSMGVGRKAQGDRLVVSFCFLDDDAS